MLVEFIRWLFGRDDPAHPDRERPTVRPGPPAAALHAGAAGAVALDSVCVVPFMRAVRARERPEMTMVFSMYRDVAGLVPPAFFAALLSFLELWSVFAATALGLVGCAWFARWIPRGMS